MLKVLKNVLNMGSEGQVPGYLQEAAEKMQLTIDRLQNTANLVLFKTDYLE
ncbi:hypothetical protein [Acinetobacter thermotolerans]|uniref:hypothetical protein n=1 Tax=Acinetobacter thermotolerans TaxID=3151487 RepID=UPI00325ABF79